MNAGYLIAIIIGGVLGYFFGWQALLFFLIPLGAIGVWMAYSFMSDVGPEGVLKLCTITVAGLTAGVVAMVVFASIFWLISLV